MTTTPTQNPVPSESPIDLKFNAGKIDEFVTSLVHQYIDRFGIQHYTIEGLRWLAQQAIAQYGWIPYGTFQAGATLTLPNQILKDTTDGEYYRWDGSFLPSGKIVPVGSTPASSGGVGVGAWISVGDSALRSMLASTTGTLMIGRPSGGNLQETIPEFYVDEFGADPTGATSSTAAVNAALAAINSLTDSRMDKSLSVKYAKLVFGKGTYLVNDILIKSGVHYAGQGAYATLIKPETGTGSFCFTTKNTLPIDQGGESVRCFRPVFSDMTIGHDLQRIYSTPIPQDGLGGIKMEYISYFTIRDVCFNSLDGVGLNLTEAWDADINSTHFLQVGNTRSPTNTRPALNILAGSTGNGSDTLRFRFLHMEGCNHMFYISPKCTTLMFDSPKFEGGKVSGEVSSVIGGVTGCTFTNAQMSWSNGTIPMMNIEGTGFITDTNTSDSNQANTNHSRGVQFINPQIADSQNLPGWYINYVSDRGPLEIIGGKVHHARYLVTGRNIQIRDTIFIQNGPGIIYTTGDVWIDGIWMHRSQVPTSGTSAQITLTGNNNRVTNCRFYTPYGLPTDGNIWIQSNSTSELWVDNCEFGGSFGNAIQPGSDANARRCTNNRLMTGASYGNLIVGFPAYGSLPSRRLSNTGGSSSISLTVAVDASVPLTNFMGGATLFAARARSSAGAYISAGAFFTDPSGNITEIADLGAKFSVNGGGASGDGQVWLQQSGGTLSVINRTTSSITVTLIGMMAEF